MSELNIRLSEDLYMTAEELSALLENVFESSGLSQYKGVTIGEMKIIDNSVKFMNQWMTLRGVRETSYAATLFLNSDIARLVSDIKKLNPDCSEIKLLESIKQFQFELSYHFTIRFRFLNETECLLSLYLLYKAIKEKFSNAILNQSISTIYIPEYSYIPMRITVNKVQNFRFELEAGEVTLTSNPEKIYSKIENGTLVQKLNNILLQSVYIGGDIREPFQDVYDVFLDNKASSYAVAEYEIRYDTVQERLNKYVKDAFGVDSEIVYASSVYKKRRFTDFLHYMKYENSYYIYFIEENLFILADSEVQLGIEIGKIY